MSKKIIIWTSDNCIICRNIKQYFKEERKLDIEEHDVNKLMSGENKNIDVMAQLAEQNMQLPVIMMDGEFVNPASIQSGRINELL